MRKRNGFVLAETLIVVLLLSITLMSLYSGFASIIYKTRNKSNNDTIDTIYKTYYVKELLDNAYVYSYTSSNPDTRDYSNSFGYYTNYLKGKTALNSICKAYDYSTGNARTVEDNENLMIVCDYNPYLSESSSSTYGEDYMYTAIKSYGIEKMYLVNPAKINGSAKYKSIMNKLDASTIDYVISRPKNLSGNYLIIKYKNKHSYPNDFAFVDNNDFLVKEDVYHSSILLTGVIKASGSSPIYLYESNDTGAAYIETEPLNLNDDYILKSTNSFVNHPGSVIVGWTNSTDYINIDEFNSCLTTKEEYKKQSKSYYEETGILCGEIGETIKFKDNTKVLYAVWCGNGKLNGALECQATYNKDKNNGLQKDDGSDNPYNDTNYVYKGKTSDNFIKIGGYCYSMTSTFGSSDSIKVAYYGPYNTTTNACDKTDAYSYNTAFNYDKSAGFAWMYNGTLSIGYIGSSIEDVAKNLKLMSPYPSQGGVSPTQTVVCKNGKSCYFGDDVIYDENTNEYTLIDTNGNEVTNAIQFGSYDASDYQKLGDKQFIKKYLCEGGNTNKCSKVYYYYNKYGTGSGTVLQYKAFEKGAKNNNLGKFKVFLSKKASYSGGKYTLSNSSDDSITLTIEDLKNIKKTIPEYDNKTVGELLSTYKYACSDLVERESNNYTCDQTYMIISPNGFIAYYVLKDGLTTMDEIYNYINGSVEKGNRKNSSSMKTNIDNFYYSNLSTHWSIIDNNATFCNNLETMKVEDLVDEPKRYLFVNHYKSDPRNENLYNRYKDCDSKEEYLYSVPGASSGNHLLKYPVGLLTYEEATYLGLRFYNKTSNPNHYLVTNNRDYSLMTPTAFSNSSTDGGINNYGYYINGIGQINDWGGSTHSFSAKPTVRIYIDKDVVSGSGSYKSPFILKES